MDDEIEFHKVNKFGKEIPIRKAFNGKSQIDIVFKRWENLYQNPCIYTCFYGIEVKMESFTTYCIWLGIQLR